MGRKMTLRGLIPEGAQKANPVRLQMDDNSITKNWVVREFHLFGNPIKGFWNNPPNNNNNTFAYLSYRASGSNVDFRDPNQFAWICATGAQFPERSRKVIDPNHIIIEDLFLTVYSTDSTTGSIEPTSANIQYLIVIEEVTTSEAEGVLQLVKALGQAEGTLI